MNPACQTFVPRLSPYVDGELGPPERVQVEQHLTSCKDCTMRTADLRAESGLLRVGMEMLADEVDFKDFSRDVMARLTPHKAPLGERLRISVSEMFTYQRGMLAGGFATATLAVLLAVTLLLRTSTPEGYASERMAVQTVRTDASAHVAPVVLETKAGNSIIWVVDHQHGVGQAADVVPEEELEMEPGTAGSALDQEQPKGGEL